MHIVIASEKWDLVEKRDSAEKRDLAEKRGSAVSMTAPRRQSHVESVGDWRFSRRIPLGRLGGRPTRELPHWLAAVAAPKMARSLA